MGGRVPLWEGAPFVESEEVVVGESVVGELLSD